MPLLLYTKAWNSLLLMKLAYHKVVNSSMALLVVGFTDYLFKENAMFDYWTIAMTFQEKVF